MRTRFVLVVDGRRGCSCSASVRAGCQLGILTLLVALTYLGEIGHQQVGSVFLVASNSTPQVAAASETDSRTWWMLLIIWPSRANHGVVGRVVSSNSIEIQSSAEQDCEGRMYIVLRFTVARAFACATHVTPREGHRLVMNKQ